MLDSNYDNVNKETCKKVNHFPTEEINYSQKKKKKRKRDIEGNPTEDEEISTNKKKHKAKKKEKANFDTAEDAIITIENEKTQKEEFPKRKKKKKTHEHKENNPISNLFTENQVMMENETKKKKKYKTQENEKNTVDVNLFIENQVMIESGAIKKKKRKKQTNEDNNPDANLFTENEMMIENGTIKKKKKKAQKHEKNNPDVNLFTENQISIENETIKKKKKKKRDVENTVTTVDSEISIENETIKKKKKKKKRDVENTVTSVDSEEAILSKDHLLKESIENLVESENQLTVGDENDMLKKRKNKKKHKEKNMQCEDTILKENSLCNVQTEEEKVTLINLENDAEVQTSTKESKRKKKKKKHKETKVPSPEQIVESSFVNEFLTFEENYKDSKNQEILEKGEADGLQESSFENHQRRKKKKKHKKLEQDNIEDEENSIKETNLINQEETGKKNFESQKEIHEHQNLAEVMNNEMLYEESEINLTNPKKKKKRKINSIEVEDYINKEANSLEQVEPKSKRRKLNDAISVKKESKLIETVYEENHDTSIKEINEENDLDIKIENNKKIAKMKESKTSGTENPKESENQKETLEVKSKEEENNSDSDFEIPDDDYLLTKEQADSLRGLMIEINFEIPSLHHEVYYHKIKQLPYKKGNFLKVEDDLIKSNFQEFCKHHNLKEDPQMFIHPIIRRNGKKFKVMGMKEKIKFYQWLSKGLPERPIINVFERFTRLFSEYKRGRFSENEDKTIMKFMTQLKKKDSALQELSRIMNRKALYIVFRYVQNLRLRDQGFRNHFKQLYDEIDLLKEVVREANVKSLDELQNIAYTRQFFVPIAERMKVILGVLRIHWAQIYVRLFSKERNCSVLKREFIDALIEDGIDDLRKINYDKYSKQLIGTNPTFLISILQRIKQQMKKIPGKKTVTEKLIYIRDWFCRNQFKYLPSINLNNFNIETIEGINESTGESVNGEEDEDKI